MTTHACKMVSRMKSQVYIVYEFLKEFRVFHFFLNCCYATAFHRWTADRESARGNQKYGKPEIFKKSFMEYMFLADRSVGTKEYGKPEISTIFVIYLKEGLKITWKSAWILNAMIFKCSFDTQEQKNKKYFVYNHFCQCKVSGIKLSLSVQV